jgi:hypothetical protein
MNDDPFEQRLQRQPLRQIPPAWREDILSAVARAASPQPSTVDSRPAPWWRGRLWPHPVAWGGVGAAWLLIFALNYAASESDTVSVATSRTTDDGMDVRMAMDLQRRVEAEFRELDFRGDLDRPKPPIGPRPRSERLIRPETCQV